MNNTDKLDFIRIASACPQVVVADVMENVRTIATLCHQIEADCSPSIITFPELCISGYTCEEMFNQQALYENVETALERLIDETSNCSALIAVGLPLIYNSRRYNVAALFRKGRLMGIVPKTYLPNSAEFYEARYFESGSSLGKEPIKIKYAGQECLLGALQIFDLGRAHIGVEICQDLWVPISPSSYAALNGANVILNLSASNEVCGKNDYRKALLTSTSSRLHIAYIYTSSGYGESSDDLVWGGSCMIYEDGQLLCENTRFDRNATWIVADVDLAGLESARIHSSNYSLEGNWPETNRVYQHIDCGQSTSTDFRNKLFRPIEQHPFFPGGIEQIKAQCREAFNIQVTGLMTRLEHIHCSKCVLGISGGLDSTLALLVCCEAFDRLGIERKGILAVTMPCFGTSNRTHDNANSLMKELGVSCKEIDIAHAVKVHLKDIGHPEDLHDAAYENAQARERTQILMDLANSIGGIVVGTGDLSELALGWCTYNGDHMSMYGVNAGVPKTLVREITRWRAESLECKDTITDIIDTPVSPELVPGEQITEDLVGPYELHDYFLWHFFDGDSPKKIFFYSLHAFQKTYSPQTILKWLKVFYKRFFSQQFKRSCLPNGPKVCKVSLSPRGDWRMSTDTSSKLWMEELNTIETTINK